MKMSKHQAEIVAFVDHGTINPETVWRSRTAATVRTNNPGMSDANIRLTVNALARKLEDDHDSRIVREYLAENKGVVKTSGKSTDELLADIDSGEWDNW